MRRSGILVGIVALACSAACTLALDLDGLSRPEAADGQAPAPVVDSGATTDAPDSDASDASDASPLCGAPNTHFCSDFDGVELSSLPLTVRNGTITLDSMVSRSPPTSLVAATEPPSTGLTYAGLDVRPGRAAATLHVAADLLVLDNVNDYVEVIAVLYSSGSSSCDIYVILQDGEWRGDAGCPARDNAVRIAPAPMGEWSHVEVDVDGVGGTVTMTVGSAKLDLPLGASFADSDLRVFAPIYWAREGGGKTRIALDNFVVRD